MARAQFLFKKVSLLRSNARRFLFSPIPCLLRSHVILYLLLPLRPQTTIGIDFKIKNVDIDGTRIKLQIWDTAGQERFRTITTSYFRGAQGILLVYDVTDRRSFESIRNWISQIQQHADVHVNKILVGNKCDMLDDKVVSTEEAMKLAKEFGIEFFECSAKNDIHVGDGFYGIARSVKDRLIADGQGGPSAGKQGLNLKSGAATQPRKNCC